MEAFEWDNRFVTGLETVDFQHRHLVDLVNKVGDFLLENSGDEAALQAVFGELATYALEHFAEEEKLMAELQVDARHVNAHTQHHRDFVTQVVSMWERRAQSSDPAAMLHGYLTSWLTVHILGEDQVMARQMESIRQGLTPAAAFEEQMVSRDNSVSALLDALYKLYHVLSVQNRELASSNQSLEVKVEERTHDLAELNQQLQREQADLKRALAHVESTQQQLLNAEKMASLGRMVAGFAHELNTPVGIAIGAVSNAERVLRETEDMLGGDEVSEDALLAKFSALREGNELALSNLQRSAALVQRLKRSSIDQDAMARRCFSLRDLIDDVVLGLKSRLQDSGVRVEVDCPEGVLIEGVPGLYEQLLVTLLGNAIRHAFAPGERVGVISLSAMVYRSNQLKIVCRDNGTGMGEEIASHVFEPFFTTQRSTGRLGLGLYMCYNLVTSKLGGSITCSSQPGEGSVFEVLAPITRVEASV